MHESTSPTSTSQAPHERYGTVVVGKERRDDFDDIIGTFGDREGEGNPRCLWDGSVCSEPATHQITFGMYPDAGNPHFESNTFCARHYAVELAQFVHFHAKQCPITLAAHLASFGAINSNP